MGWLLLISGILINVSGIFLVKGSQASEHILLTILGYLINIIGFFVISQSFKHLDVTLAYAIWSGVGSLIVLAVGIFFFKETLSVAQISFFMVVMVGVVGITVTA